MSQETSKQNVTKPKASHLTGAKLRANSAKALFDILEQGQSARQVLPKYQHTLNQKDKAWLQHAVYGVLRELPQYQHWVRTSLEKPLKGNKKVLEHLLMVGFYQLYAMRVADHAAVSSTVEAANILGGQGLKGLVNAVLRRFVRDDLAQQKVTGDAAKAGLPKWLYKGLQQQYPEQLDDILLAMQHTAPMWLRINPHYVSVSQYQQMLNDRNIASTTIDALPHGLCLATPAVVTELPGYHAGWFAVQDGAAQLAAHILQPAPGERGLDACAAPGGKTAHLLTLQSKLSQLVAIDNDTKRLERVAENLSRLGLEATLICADASHPEQWDDAAKGEYDFILCDAPCSATGVIRKHPDIRWLRKASDIDQLVVTQQHILTQLWQVLKPGGRLLYATCSILEAENAAQVQAFLTAHSDAMLAPLPTEILHDFANSGALGLQITPNTAQCDGFYYALLHKQSNV